MIFFIICLFFLIPEGSWQQISCTGYEDCQCKGIQTNLIKNVNWSCQASGILTTQAAATTKPITQATTTIPTTQATTTLARPQTSCLNIKKNYPNSVTGYYNITVQSVNIKVWCDMTTNGGGYTFFLTDANFDKLTQSILDTISTDKTHYILTLRKESTQNCCVVTQLDAFRNIPLKNFFRSISVAIPSVYSPAINEGYIGGSYMYWPVMTKAEAGTAEEHGIKVNGKTGGFLNNVNSNIAYFALFPKATDASNLMYSNIFPLTAKIFNACDTVVINPLPDDAYFFMEMQFNGVAYTQTDGRADSLGVWAANIGFK